MRHLLITAALTAGLLLAQTTGDPPITIGDSSCFQQALTPPDIPLAQVLIFDALTVGPLAVSI